MKKAYKELRQGHSTSCLLYLASLASFATDHGLNLSIVRLTTVEYSLESTVLKKIGDFSRSTTSIHLLNNGFLLLNIWCMILTTKWYVQQRILEVQVLRCNGISLYKTTSKPPTVQGKKRKTIINTYRLNKATMAWVQQLLLTLCNWHFNDARWVNNQHTILKSLNWLRIDAHRKYTLNET